MLPHGTVARRVRSVTPASRGQHLRGLPPRAHAHRERPFQARKFGEEVAGGLRRVRNAILLTSSSAPPWGSGRHADATATKSTTSQLSRQDGLRGPPGGSRRESAAPLILDQRFQGLSPLHSLASCQSRPAGGPIADHPHQALIGVATCFSRLKIRSIAFARSMHNRSRASSIFRGTSSAPLTHWRITSSEAWRSRASSVCQRGP